MGPYQLDVIVRILTTYLKLTSKGEQPTLRRISSESLVGEEITRNILKEYGLEGEASSSKRVKAAVTALTIGVEGDRIAKYLHWREFEELSAELMKRAGYTVYIDTRIIENGRRHQIDLIAYNTSLLLVVDCKHWVKPPAYTQRRRIIFNQEKRIKALMRLEGDVQVNIIPIVLTLYEPRELIVEGYPYVPIQRISGFIEWLQNNYPHIKCFKTRISLDKLKASSRRVISKSDYEEL